MTPKFSRLKLSILLAAVIFITSYSCTRKREKQPITWLYGGYGNVEMIYGNVKQVIEEPFDKNALPNHLEYTFDKKGDVIKVENIYVGGVTTIKYNTIYKNGKKVKSIGIESNGEGKVFGSPDVYKYDKYGHIISFGTMMNVAGKRDSIFDTSRFRYDNAGYLVEEDEDLTIHKYRYLYNEKGEMTGLERAHTDDWSKFRDFKKDTVRYILIDSKNNWLKAIRFGDTLSRRITYY